MDLGYLLVGGIAVAAFIFIMINKRSAGYRAILSKLENENNMLELRLSGLEEERQVVLANVAQLKGKVAAHEEAKAAEQRAVSDAALQRAQASAESFLDYLIRVGIVTREHLLKVKTYKEKNRNTQSVEELLIMLDYVKGAVLQQAKVAYDESRRGGD